MKNIISRACKCILYYIMDAEDYAEMEPRYIQLMSDVVDSNIKLLNTLRMYRAAQDAALGRVNKEEQTEYVNKIKQGNNPAKSYNLMRALTGSGGPMLNEDVPSGTSGLRYFSGAKKVDKAASEKVRKSYELMRLFGAR
jgi:hypothetical protein